MANLFNPILAAVKGPMGNYLGHFRQPKYLTQGHNETVWDFDKEDWVSTGDDVYRDRQSDVDPRDIQRPVFKGERPPVLRKPSELHSPHFNWGTMKWQNREKNPLRRM